MTFWGEKKEKEVGKKNFIKSEGQTGAIAPRLDTSCTDRESTNRMILLTYYQHYVHVVLASGTSIIREYDIFLRLAFCSLFLHFCRLSL